MVTKGQYPLIIPAMVLVGLVYLLLSSKTEEAKTVFLALLGMCCGLTAWYGAQLILVSFDAFV